MLNTLKQTLTANLNKIDVEGYTAGHLLPLIEKYEAGQMSKFQLSNKILKWREKHLSGGSQAHKNVANFCDDLIKAL